MAKQIVNIGTSANDRTGDSLRSAFNKINENFTELYTELGINSDDDLNLGSFEFTGSTLTTTDSTAIVIDQAATITGDFTVGGDIVPNVNEEHNLGSATRRFKDLYLSGSTIDLGGTTLSIVDGNLQIGGVDVAAGDIDYSEILNTPAIPNLGNWTFSSSVLSDGSTGNAVIQSSPFAGSKLILRARGPSDQDWIFDQDGHLEMPGTFTVGGTGFVNLNNDAQGDTFYGGVTTDKAILFLKGSDYLAGSDNGGGVTIQGGSARNSGDNGDVIISSGNGGLSGTGSVSIIADNAVSLIATQISVAGEFTNTLNADISGSVFADDSTLLVDGVDGKVVGNFIGNTINVEEESDLIINTSGTQEDTSPVGIYSNTFKFTAQGELIFDSGFGEIKAADGAILRIQYLANSEIHWATAPETVKEALDRIAAAIYAVNGNTPI